MAYASLSLTLTVSCIANPNSDPHPEVEAHLRSLDIRAISLCDPAMIEELLAWIHTSYTLPPRQEIALFAIFFEEGATPTRVTGALISLTVTLILIGGPVILACLLVSLFHAMEIDLLRMQDPLEMKAALYVRLLDTLRLEEESHSKRGIGSSGSSGSSGGVPRPVDARLHLPSAPTLLDTAIRLVEATRDSKIRAAWRNHVTSSYEAFFEVTPNPDPNPNPNPTYQAVFESTPNLSLDTLNNAEANARIELKKKTERKSAIYRKQQEEFQRVQAKMKVDSIAEERLRLAAIPPDFSVEKSESSIPSATLKKFGVEPFLESYRKGEEISIPRGVGTPVKYDEHELNQVNKSEEKAVSDQGINSPLITMVEHSNRHYNGRQNVSITACSCSPCGYKMVTSSQDGLLRVWGLPYGDLIADLRGHTGVVTGCAWSSEKGIIVTSSLDETIRVWDAVEYQGIDIKKSAVGRVMNCAVSPDGARIIACGTHCQISRTHVKCKLNIRGDIICDPPAMMKDPEEVGRLPAPVLCCVFHPKENYVATGGRCLIPKM